MTCEHENFSANVTVARLEDKGSPTSFMAEIKLQCALCGTRFQFLGLEAGLDTQGARVSLDGPRGEHRNLPARQLA